MNDNDYNALPGLRWSRISRMGVSPAHYRHALEAGGIGDTPSLSMGRVVHLLTLEPERAGEVVWYDGRRDRRTKAYNEFLAEHEGCTVLTKSDYDQAHAMADAVRSSPIVTSMGLLSGGEAEVPLVWMEDGQKFKAKADYLIRHPSGSATLVDLKTTRDVSLSPFARACARYEYHGQMAHYSRGIREALGVAEAKVYIVAVEGDAPHDVAVYRVGEDTLWLGEQRRAALLRLLAECERSGVWPGKVPEVQELAMPTWAWDRDDPTEKEV